MNAAFDEALRFTLKWEGGFSDDARDRGGATKYGVSLRFLRGLPDREGDVDKDGEVGVADVRALTREEAAGLFRRHFWEPLRLDAFPEMLAMTMFDAAVNMGTGKSAAFLQESLNLLLPGESALKADGVVGPKTLSRLEEALETADGEMRLVRETLKRRAERYLAMGRTDQYAWAAGGWMNRTRDLWDRAVGGPCPF